MSLFQRCRRDKMPRSICSFLCLIALLLNCGRAFGADTLTVRDIKGARCRPLEAHGNRAVVLFFILHDCPICNSYAPEMNRISQQYRSDRVAFYFVYVESDLQAAQAAKHASDYGFTDPVLLDPTHILVKKAGVTVAPEAVVFTAAGKLAYRGRIDDLYVTFGQQRHAATERDLREALDAVLSDKPAPHPVTQAIGCFVTTRS